MLRSVRNRVGRCLRVGYSTIRRVTSPTTKMGSLLTTGHWHVARKRRLRGRQFERLECRTLLTGLVISELMAINNSVPLDEDGDASDWIEIYNPTDSQVQLGGWHLTDDDQDFGKWTFPNATIGPGEYLLLFASQKDRAVAGTELHVNFKLDGDGEYLALVMPDGVTVAHEYVGGFPQQLADVSYGIREATVTSQIFVGEAAAARVFVPVDDGLGDTWTGAATDEPFDDSSWTSGITGIGYALDPNSPLASLIETDVEDIMLGQNGTAYVRLPFDLDQPGVVNTLTLRMKFDDGFVAYLNGRQIAERNVPAELDFDSTSTADRPTSEALVIETIDVTPYVGALRAGSNVLAIHALNDTPSSGEFLVVPELVAEVTTVGPRQYFLAPTPGEANVEGALGVVQDTKFSVDRGFFSEAFQVEIATETAGAEIRYTLDGSRPTATRGAVFSVPIDITTTTTLRAAAFRPGFLPTNVDTQTYLFLSDVLRQDAAGLPSFADWGHAGPDWEIDPEIVESGNLDNRLTTDDLQSIPTLSLVLPWEDMFGAGGQGIYIQGSGIERAVSVERINTDGSSAFQIDGTVEIQGGSSTNRWEVDKLSMRLKFKRPGRTKLDYPIFGDEATDRFDTLILDALYNYTFVEWKRPTWADNSKYIQDQFVANLQNLMSGVGPHGRFHHVYINGLYWGLYNVHERPDESFASSYFGGKKEDYDVLKHSQFTLVSGSGDNYAAMLDLVGRDLSIDENYQAVAGVVDLVSLADYMVANFYAGNFDWDRHNWYATFNREALDGRWRFHSWDAEGVLTDVGIDVTGVFRPGAPSNIHRALSSNVEYRLLFADRVQQHFFNAGVMSPEGASAVYRKLVDEIDRAITAESARWGDNGRSQPYTRTDWLAVQSELFANYFPRRTNEVLGQLKRTGFFPSIQAPELNQHGGQVSVGFLLDFDNQNAAGTVYYTTDDSDPRLVGGALNADSAQLFDGEPIALNASTTIKARVLLDGQWSPLIEVTFIVGEPASLRITEIMYNPPRADVAGGESDVGNDQFEFIELMNTGEQTILLEEVRFSAGVEFNFAMGNIASLAPAERVVIVRNTAAFVSRYGDDLSVAGEFSGDTRLDNGGELIRLDTRLGQLIQQFTYDDDWYRVTDGRGFSLVIVDEQADLDAWSIAEGWRPGATFGGTPGAADNGPPAGAIVINEILAHSEAPTGDWIELFNTTSEPIDVGGWFLSDDAADLTKYKLPAGTQIPANGFVAFTEEMHFGNPADSGARAIFALNEQGGTVRLTSVDPNTGQAGGYREGVSFDATELDATLGRHVNSFGDVDFVATDSPTLGAANAPPRIPDVIINEIMYNPPDGGAEFIELFNRSDSPVALFDPDHPANTWRFGNGVRFGFPTGITLDAGEYLLVVGIDPAEFRLAHDVPQSVVILGPYVGQLDNSGETVAIYMPAPPAADMTVPQILVERVKYNDRAPWSDQADGVGSSLSRLAPVAFVNDASHWGPGTTGGTPGAANIVLDVTPPDAPANLRGIVVSEARIDLAWDAASDPETGIKRYRIYRNGVELGSSATTAFADLTVEPATSYTYQVSAENVDGAEGNRSDSFSVAILTIDAVRAENENSVRVVFSEPLDHQAAEKLENYETSGFSILGAVVADDEMTVILSTSNLTDGQAYGLLVTGLMGTGGGRLPQDGVQVNFTRRARVGDGLVVLYELEENSGDVVHDTSGFGTPFDLSISNIAAVTWIDGGLTVDTSTIISSIVPATKIYNAITASNAITIEAWIRPASLDLSGPARIVSFSKDKSEQNFMFGQQTDTYVNRLRTTTTNAGGQPALVTPGLVQTAQLAHVVYTRDADGNARTYVDGVMVASSLVGGDTSSWNPNFRFALANEITANRPWTGEMHLVAIYSRALSLDETRQNFFAGANSITPPPVPLIVGIDQDTAVADGITGDNTLVFFGTAEAGSNVTLRELSLGTVGTAAASATGDWSIDATGTVLPDGSYVFSATAENAFGIFSAVSAELIVEIDTVAPVAPVVVSIDADDGASDSDAVTSDATLVFSGTAEPDSTVTLSEPELGMLGVATTNEAGEWIVDATSTILADGTYSFSAIARDVAGNESGAATAFVVEVVARHCVVADLTCNGFVDFEDLTVLLASWNQDVAATQGNLVDAANTPVNFEDLTVLLANWTGPAPAGSPHQEATAARSSISDEDRIRAKTEVFHRIGKTDAMYHESRRSDSGGAARRELPGPTDSTLGRFQAVAVDQDSTASMRLNVF
ncbi:MAG: lamin tail domain-containing protein [Planctomycetes bacterium]|nr:lamin tail domain-containing protein [Planctomycetota bacterium]